jgi:hypothetical protein
VSRVLSFGAVTPNATTSQSHCFYQTAAAAPRAKKETQTFTMDEPPPQQRPAVSPLLTSTNTTKQLYRDDLGYHVEINEYRLHGQPESLKGFTDLFFLDLEVEDGDVDEDRIVWVTKNAFVLLSGDRGDYEDGWFYLELKDPHTHHYLSIHASTLEESIICLDFIVGLQDTHFQVMDLTYKADEDSTR